MPYHHEYHLASTLDKEKEDVISPVISVVTGNRTLILTRRVLIGICALVIAGIVIAMCVHQQILFHWFHNKNDSTSALENSLANDSLSFENTDDHVRKELLKGVSSLNVYEHSYVKTLSQEKAESILQLRSEVADHVTRYYMSRATYLSTWLRAKDWVVEDARDMLLDHLEWRVEYDIDSVLEANFTYFEDELPYYGDGIDKTGGPVYSLNIEDWDLRKVVVGGDRKDFFRYTFRVFERAITTGFVAQDNGTNFSQGMFIMNVNKYTFAKHGCFACLSVLGGFLFGLDDNYPGWLHHIILINSSELAEAVINMMLPYLNGDNRAAIKVYGFNKEEWQTKILSLVDADQLRPEFGGTKIDTHEF